jgi:hypothetical protein
MTRSELTTAGDLLGTAADGAPDNEVAQRMRDLAGQLETLSERDQAPDHGRLARIELALDDVADAVDDDVAADVNEAHEHVIAFRETVEGV